MTASVRWPAIVLAAWCGLVMPAEFRAGAASRNLPPLVSTGPGGRLVYDADAQGNRVPDFSHCGYAGGDRAIPAVLARVDVPPGPGDRTALIQAAIDQVAALPPDGRGMRGAVLLLPGRHEVSGSLRLAGSGVVLRGQGIGSQGTVLVATGRDRRTVIRVVGPVAPARETSPGWSIVDDYVPVGATAFRLRDATGLREGDSVVVIRPSTPAWIERLGAAEFGGGVGGGWKPGTRDLTWERTLVRRETDRAVIDVPVTTALEAGLGGARVERQVWPGRVTGVGIENLEIESTFAPGNPRDEEHAWCGITMEGVRDAWVRQVVFRHLAGSAVCLLETASRVTVEDCLSVAPVSEDGGGRRNTFFTQGQQTLFLRCHAEHGRHDFSAGHCAAGPNAFVQCEAVGPTAESGPVQSWASGVLYDNVRIDGHALALGSRGPRLGGAGWAAASSVLWNCSAARILCASPPGARNWSFGSWGEFDGDGTWRSSNDFMDPESLWVAQLGDRLGTAAVRDIRLMPRPRGGSSNPSMEEAQRLAAAARQPAESLVRFILNARQRHPIPSAPSGIPALPPAPVNLPGPATVASPGTLVVTNGWITLGGRLPVGGIAGVAWWRGNPRPGEQAEFQPALTRFVPGRTGHGFTDDLDEVARRMVATNAAALEHHYGLWYDRRRDDHERVRRLDGDVWPPFFEQPFARSGRGTAWDGLSRYDLTAYNPWYWSRLREFAGICSARGLLLFHQQYFQHNVLEAGAHWADSPWRPANNINDTGFPEPPNYAGDKRIFMAEAFYDVTHPVRRDLHQRFIRQGLGAFTNEPNVIQFTSAEFTGPRHFMEFWLDTVAEWKRDTAGGRRGRDPVIALSATRDVQDAILGDPVRASLVDVIDFRYWWRTAKGEFAPPGGRNLAPRQFERSWRGGRPTDADLAGMAAEYRLRYPGKAVLCNFDAARWAWLCAGGSLPRLPATTDAGLLDGIPRMVPWTAGTAPRMWVLREAGRQLLVFHTAGARLDLTAETGVFRRIPVDPGTGRLGPAGEGVAGGAVVVLPGAAGGTSVTWLKREEP